MTTILHLETATKTCSVALSVNAKLIDVIEIHGDQYIHGEKLTLFIQEILTKNSITFDNLSAVSISSGPGSYTGLRIGLSTAKGLCYALSIPLIAIPTHQILFQMAIKSSSEGPQNTIALLDARRTEVYMEVFDTQGKSIQDLQCALLEQTDISSFLPALVVGDSNLKAQTYWTSNELIWRNEVLSARFQVQIAFQKFQAQQFEDLAYCSPIYLKGANGALL